MSRSRVEIKVILLEVFTMIAFAAGETEGALFKDRITAIPERQRKTDQLMAIADARESVLVPAIGARSRVIVWQVVPRGAMRAVVFTHGAPRALADVRPPALPMCLALTRLFEPLLLGSHSSFCFSVHGHWFLNCLERHRLDSFPFVGWKIVAV